MADIRIRDLDDGVVERLKERALRRGRCLEREVRDILTQAAGTPKVSAEVAQKMLARFRRRFKGRCFSDSTKLISEDRNG